ncbi:MAG: tetratricopeptide repeat protein [Phycisphaerales bacterium]
MSNPQSTPKSRIKSSPFRACRIGAIDSGMLGLVVAAIASLVLIYFACRSLLIDPNAEQSDTNPSESAETQPQAAAEESAPTQTIEQVLESVQVYVSAEEFGPAMTILKGAIAQYPSDVDLRFAMVDLYMMTQDFPNAYEQIVAAIDHTSGVDHAAQFQAGTLANTIGEPELAESHYRAAMEAAPNNADYPLYLANIQFKLNKLDQAKASLAIAARLAPDRAMIYATWAKITLRQNKLTIAQQQIEKARKLEPHVPAWTIIEASIQKRDGNPERAIELLTALPQSAMEDPETMRLLAESYGMIGRPADAASRMVDFATLHSEDELAPQAAFDAAVWLERADQRDEAVLWGRRARDLGHKRAQGWLDSLPKKD